MTDLSHLTRYVVVNRDNQPISAAFKRWRSAHRRAQIVEMSWGDKPNTVLPVRIVALVAQEIPRGV